MQQQQQHCSDGSGGSGGSGGNGGSAGSDSSGWTVQDLLSQMSTLSADLRDAVDTAVRQQPAEASAETTGMTAETEALDAHDAMLLLLHAFRDGVGCFDWFAQVRRCFAHARLRACMP